ncbi:MAG: hypothetical protein ABI811_06720 [Acidobacteriota bacterium]
MGRRLFVAIVRLHPRPFRERFEAELLEAFDLGRASLGTAPLLWDALRSLFRQWLLRPPMPGPDVHIAVGSASSQHGHVPGCVQLEAYRIRPAAKASGIMLALAMFGALQFATNHWSGPRLQNAMGAFRHAVGLPISRVEGPVAKKGAATVDVPRAPDSIWDDLAEKYFAGQPVLRALDSDGDYRLSAAEIAAAPSVLPMLDKNRDGKLDVTECLDPPMRDPVLMPLSPVLRQLDADRNSEVSAAEMRNAAAALLILDASGDGQLHPVEFLPERGVNRTLRFF